MTNFEYFEKNNVTVAEAMKKFNEQKTITSFDAFLKAKHGQCKFKFDDIIVLQLNNDTKDDGWKHNVVFEVVYASSTGCYSLKYLTPSNNPTVVSLPHEIGDIAMYSATYIDSACELY